MSEAVSTKTHAKHALDVSSTKRKAKRGEAKPGKAYHASHAVAQKRIKRNLKIVNKVDADAYSAIGRCLDEVAQTVVTRFIQMAGPKNTGPGSPAYPTLTHQTALSAIFSLVPIEEHARVVDFVNDALDAYHGVHIKK